jgi:hypothetical protein
LLLGAGCVTTNPATEKDDKDEQAVRATFASFQQALKKHDGPGILALFDSRSRARVESAARDARMSLEEFVKSEEFNSRRYDRERYEEIPGARLTRVTLQGDTATGDCILQDGDKERVSFLREGGQWKVRDGPVPSNQ